MRKIRILAALSMDGFYVPLKLQQQYNFIPEYKDFYKNADIILTNIGGLKDLQAIELDFGKPAYKIEKDMSLASTCNPLEKKPLSIEELRNGNNGVTLITGDNRKLINSLFLKGWVDEIDICLFPVLLFKGKRLFPALPEYSAWNVKRHQLYDSGITAIHYYK